MTKHQHTHRRRAAALRLAAVGAVAALGALTAVAPATAAEPAGPAAFGAAGAGGTGGTGGAAVRLSLPAPTGRHLVGGTTLHLVDRSHPDPWQPAQDHRELMVSVFYPATTAPPAGPGAAPYMLPAAAAHFDAVTADQLLQLHVPPGRADWAGTATHVLRDAPVADHGRGADAHPVIVYSPGLGEPRTWGTTLATDLAGRGYVVVTVDHTFEAPEVQFPDGSLVTMLPPSEAPDAFIRRALDIRVADTRFVLDQLALLNAGQNPDADGRPLPPGLAGALDLTRVGMFGHSMGGTAAALAMDADHRIGVGLDMDGNLNNYDGSLMPVAEHGLDRPFLLLGKDGETDTGPGWQAFRANTPGWSRQLTLRGGEHDSFTDAEALIPQLGLPPADRADDIGTIDPALAIRTNETYIAAYFDHWLRGSRTHLLDGPSPQYPAMEFVD